MVDGSRTNVLIAVICLSAIIVFVCVGILKMRYTVHRDIIANQGIMLDEHVRAPQTQTEIRARNYRYRAQQAQAQARTTNPVAGHPEFNYTLTDVGGSDRISLVVTGDDDVECP